MVPHVLSRRTGSRSPSPLLTSEHENKTAPMKTSINTYATDGRCHTADPGTFGHECGRPATSIGTIGKGFACSFCDECKGQWLGGQRLYAMGKDQAVNIEITWRGTRKRLAVGCPIVPAGQGPCVKDRCRWGPIPIFAPAARRPGPSLTPACLGGAPGPQPSRVRHEFPCHVDRSSL
jgi:hypothetical protein